MLNTIMDMKWNHMQELPRAGGIPADYSTLLSALDSGWQISEAARLLSGPRGGYLLTLVHPGRKWEQSVRVDDSHWISALLEEQRVPRPGTALA